VYSAKDKPINAWYLKFSTEEHMTTKAPFITLDTGLMREARTGGNPAAQKLYGTGWHGHSTQLPQPRLLLTGVEYLLNKLGALM
jgi:hypothetical protein